VSARALAILQAKPLAGESTFIFPGRSGTKPLSTMVFEMACGGRSAHSQRGFRSSFRDWAAKTTSFPREAAEMALAHVVENRVEAACRRGDLLAKRREMMEQWVTCEGQPAATDSGTGEGRR